MEDVAEAPIAQSLKCVCGCCHLKHIPVAGLVLECCPQGLFHAASCVLCLVSPELQNSCLFCLVFICSDLQLQLIGAVLRSSLGYVVC